MIRTLALSTAAALAVGSGGAALAASPGGDAGGTATAVATAKALLDEAPVIAGATRSATAPVTQLKRAPELAEYTKLVQRERYWTVDESWRKAFADLTATVPSGLTSDGTGRFTGPKAGDVERFAIDRADPLPTGIAYAVLLIAVAPDGHDKAAIGVYAQAVPQPPRPAAELVPTSVQRAHVKLHTRYGHIIRGNTVTGTAAATLVADFDALVVEPPEAIACPADFGRSDIVTFHFNGVTMVGRTGVCNVLAVTRNGHSLPALQLSAAFLHDLRADLAPATGSGHHPKRPPTEHIPLSVHRVQLVRRNLTGPPDRRTVTVTGRAATRLVRTFDAMTRLPRHSAHCNVVGGPETIATFRSAAHTWVASESACTDVVVTRDGKPLPTLLPSTAWERAVEHDLGQ